MSDARGVGGAAARQKKAFDANLERLHRLYPKLIDLRLDRLVRLLAALGDPQFRLPPVLHVAGTNGKGSVCAFARAVAEAAGLRAHVYTSPHLVRFNERIRIAGALVSDDALAGALDEIERVNADHQITVFEAITAAAFHLFAQTPADVCIVEVGLGGRFDATSVVRPAACAITAISMDHQDFLGSEIALIAREKAGILRPGIPAVVGHQNLEAMAEIVLEAEKVGARLLLRGRDWEVAETPRGIVLDGLALPEPGLKGAHQVENAAIASLALRAAGFALPADAVARGLRDVEWPARLQKLTGALLAGLPPGSELWLDGAHNPGGAEILAAQLRRWEGPTAVILGMKQSKDVAEFIRILRPFAARLFAVAEPSQHLALPVEKIIEASGGAAIPGPDVRGALAQISAPMRVLICGSLYLAGAVLKLDAAPVRWV